MAFSLADQMIVRWAVDHGYLCTRDRIEGFEQACVTVLLDHGTAFFQDGCLVRIVCRRDGRFVSEMARELAVVFALCGYVTALDGALGLPVGEGHEHQVCAESA